MPKKYEVTVEQTQYGDWEAVWEDDDGTKRGLIANTPAQVLRSVAAVFEARERLGHGKTRYSYAL